MKRLFHSAIKFSWIHVALGVLFSVGAARAQFGAPSAALLPPGVPAASAGAVLEQPVPTNKADNPAIVDPMVKQASGCCGNNLGPRTGMGLYGCANGNCVPGRRPCDFGCDMDTCLGRFFSGIYEGLCCPDPCYEPAWILGANAAFFQDSPRPVTQTRIRWDSAFHYNLPDGAEYLWAKTGMGGKGPMGPSPSLNYQDLTLYQEIAAKGTASAFVEIPYRTIDPIANASAAGMGDMNLGVKSVLLDRELLLVTFQFRTYILTGNFTKGVGNGHVSLEPSLLAALKLTPNTYLQTQIAEWIPIGGTPGFAGSVFNYHFSLNHNLYQQGDFLNVVGTAELNGYTFRGQYTDFTTGTPVGLSGKSYLNAGPGIRFMFCNRCDIGVGMGFGFGGGPGPEQIYRTEFRVRY